MGVRNNCKKPTSTAFLNFMTQVYAGLEESKYCDGTFV